MFSAEEEVELEYDLTVVVFDIIVFDNNSKILFVLFEA
jgi:hypothetical protein